MKKRIDHREPVVLEDSPDDLFAPLDAGVPVIVSEPLVVPKLTMEQALGIDLGPELDDVAAYIANYTTGTEAPLVLLSEITGTPVVMEPVRSAPMLTVEFYSFHGDSADKIRFWAAGDLLWKASVLRRSNIDMSAFTGRTLDESSMIITKVREDDLFVHHTVIGQWVTR